MYVMSEVSLKMFYFALFDDGLTLKNLKLAFIGFLIQTLHMINIIGHGCNDFLLRLRGGGVVSRFPPLCPSLLYFAKLNAI